MEARPAQTARVAYALSFDYLFTGTSKWAGGVFFLAVVRRQVADVAGLEACRARDGLGCPEDFGQWVIDNIH